MDDSGLECALSVRPEAGGDIGLAFDIRNSGREPQELELSEPFLAFDLTAEAGHGPIPVVQPAYDVPVRPRAERIEPGRAVRIETPVTLRFDPDVPPSGGDVPTRWSLPSEPVPVRLRATIRVDGHAFAPCEARFDPRLA
jgi:hypothetical protein